MKNLILIGMMGCGKTTVGGLLSRRLGLELADTDALIEEEAQSAIRDIFRDYGEERFRDWEQTVSRELGRKTGLVIACGGGLPLQDGAIAALKGSGPVFWLDRDPGVTFDSLDSLGKLARPLAQSGRADFLARYEYRAPVYRRWADHVIDNRGTPEEAAARIAAIYLEGEKP